MNMMNDNKNNLQMILAAQRTRRLTLNPPVLKRSQGMSWKTFFALLGVLVFGVVVLVAMMILARQSVSSDSTPAPGTQEVWHQCRCLHL